MRRLIRRMCVGIPTLEKSHNKRYGKDPAYQEYKATTNLLIPGPKQKRTS